MKSKQWFTIAGPGTCEELGESDVRMPCGVSLSNKWSSATHPATLDLPGPE